jgi:ribonuclease-3 family protein
MIQQSGLTLAYLGDAVYELYVREYFIDKGFTKVDDLHQRVVAYTNAEGQANAYHKIASLLTEEEQAFFKRGRNAKTNRTAKSASITDYRHATGLESLFGYLYLSKQEDRIQELLALILT